MVNVWNRTSQRSIALNKALNHNKRLIVHHTAQSLFVHSENIFICISDEIELRLFFQDNFDIDNTEEKTFQDKGIIIMTSMSPDTAKDMSNMIEKKGGRYLEALIQWSSKDNDRFILLTAGDESLFKTIHPYTKAISISAEFLGNAGSACCFYLILQLIKGVCLAGLVEGVHLAERLGFENSDFQSLFETSQLCNNFLKDKMAKITNRQMELSDQRLEDLQTDMKLGLHMSNELQQQLHICTVTHQLFKHSCKLDYGGFDPAAIYFRNKH
ncbi:unnamed protein product [Callosobruchus maculatus]|uniref:6-phosphogluconate dehydrogenase NADP-binding domain-containing protein n=1 Tax=Callosobruchus maculatus TaxID=64391 RepID=A0A653DDL9_CALMS|nr:unnamed protein product [Callosobruchus maculatus]